MLLALQLGGRSVGRSRCSSFGVRVDARMELGPVRSLSLTTAVALLAAILGVFLMI